MSGMHRIARGWGLAWAIMVVGLLLPGCASRSGEMGAPRQGPGVPAGAKAAPPGAPAGGKAAAPGASATGAPAQDAGPASRRKLIKTASMTVSVVSVTEAWATIRKLVDGAGGFFSASSTSGPDDDERSATLQIKVPAERLDGLMDSVGALGRVRSRSEHAEDVTGQYLDMEARLRNLQREEARLLELLQKAGSVKELLEVERELARVRGEIEAIQTDLKHMDERVAYSTLDVTLVTSSTAGVGGEFWDVSETFGNAWLVFRVILLSLVRGGIYLLSLLPFVLPVWVLLKWRSRRRAAPAPGHSPGGDQDEGRTPI